MDLRAARELLRNPRSLTAAQWREAYLAVQDHNIRGGGAETDEPGGSDASVANEGRPAEVMGDHPTG